MNEKYCYFIFDGYSRAASASEMLKKNGIRNKLVKAPAMMRNCCSFAVVTFIDDCEKSEKVFKCNKHDYLMRRYM